MLLNSDCHVKLCDFGLCRSVAEKTDAFLEKNVMKVLGNAGEMVKEGAKAPGMPMFMKDYIDEAHEFLWDDVERELCEGILLVRGRGRGRAS